MGIDKVLFVTLLLLSAATVAAQQAAPPGLDPAQATELAELMCRQLPNVATILERIQTNDAPLGPAKDPPVIDDVYDTLVGLGPYSLPCLVDQSADTRWMPDPRSEPLLGIPVIGDVAYMILADMGVRDVLPALAHKKPDQMRMDDYFLWPSVGDHRKRLQAAVRAWLGRHPGCCAAPQIIRTIRSAPKFRMSAADLARAKTQFSRLRPGMSSEQVIDIVGKPDAIDRNDGSGDPSVSGSRRLGLLGFCASDHNENLAYIYFTERWGDEIALRDPLRDRYLILFFSAQGKFTRMFSNVADIPPIFPTGQAIWERLMWGPPVKKKG
jgi:hypothetical protein